jgi:hypothetical protein
VAESGTMHFDLSDQEKSSCLVFNRFKDTGWYRKNEQQFAMQFLLGLTDEPEALDTWTIPTVALSKRKLQKLYAA